MLETAKSSFLRIVLLSFALLFSALSFAQKTGQLVVKGTALDGSGKPISGVAVNLVQSDVVLYSDTTKNNGRFEIPIEFMKKYNLQFVAKGFYTSFAAIDANIDSSRISKKYVYTLYVSLPNIDTSASYNENTFRNKPFLKIFWSDLERKFTQSDDDLESFVADVYDPEGLKLYGVLKNNNGQNLSNVKLLIMEGNKIKDSIRTDSLGNFDYKIAHNNIAKISIESDGHYPMFLDVNTLLPKEHSKKEFNLTEQISLIPKSENNINPEAFKQSYKKIAFNETETKFEKVEKITTDFEKVLNEPKAFPVNVTGQLTADSGISLANTQVVIYDKNTNKIINTATTDSLGNYQLNAPMRDGLDIKFVRDGYLSPYVELDASVSNDEADSINTTEVNKSVELPPIPLLNENASQMSPEILTEPIAEVNFNNLNKKFEVKKSNTDNLKAVTDSLKKFAEADTFSYPTDWGKLVVQSRVYEFGADAGVSKVTVKLLRESGHVVEETLTDAQGLYNLSIPFKGQFKLVYEKRGYFSEFLLVNTDLKGDTKKMSKYKKFGIPEFPLVNKRISKTREINPDAFGNPITKIEYNGKKFEEDFEMIQAFIQDLNGPFKDRTVIINGVLAGDFSRKENDNFWLLLKENNEVIDTVPFDKKGRYELVLEYDKTYQLELDSEEYFKTFSEINTHTNLARLERENQKFTARDFTIVRLNPDFEDEESLFSNAIQKIYIDPISHIVKENKRLNEEFNNSFNNALKEIERLKRFIAFSGRVRDTESNRLKDIKVYLYEQDAIIDSALTDRRGGYELKAPFRRMLKVVYKSANHHETFVEINTKAPKEAIVDMKADIIDVVLAQKSEEYIDKNILKKPFTQLLFDEEKSIFKNNTEMGDSYVYDLLAPKRAKLAEEQRQKQIEDSISKIKAPKDTTTKVLAVKEVKEKAPRIKKESKEKAPKNLNGKDDSELAKAKAVNQATKNDFTEELARSVSGNRDVLTPIVKVLNKESNLTSIKLTSLESPKINLNDFSRYVRKDEDIEAKQTQAQLFNELALVRSYTLRRENPVKIDVDSIFTLPQMVKIESHSRLINVYQVETDIVRTQGKKIEFVAVTNWFIFSNHYKNGVKINEEEYLTELNNYRKLANQN